MKALTSALLAVASVTTAAAQESSLNRPGSGARAAGMGNAFIAVSDDGTAASWNPAGLTQLRKSEFSLVYSASRRNQFLEGYRTLDRTAVFTSLKTPTRVGDLEFASAAVPFSITGRPMTLQVGWRRLYQISGGLQGDITRVPTALSGRPAGRISFDNNSDGSVDLWSVAGAVRVTSRVSVGLSADFYHGGWDERVNSSEVPGLLGPADFISTRISHGISGNTFNLGVLVAYPSVRFGAVYHGALSGSYEVTQSRRSSLAEPFDAHFGGDDRITLHFPRSVGLGVAWLPKPLLRLAADLTFDQWTKFLIEGTPDSPNQPLSGFDGLPPELSATRNTVTLNAGLERLFPIKERFVPLRLGFSREPQGGRDPFLREDIDQLVVAAGTGLNSNSLKLDLSLEYRWGSFHSSQSISTVYQVGRAEELGLPLPPEAQGTTRIQEWRLKVSVIYRLINADKIRNFVRKTFGS